MLVPAAATAATGCAVTKSATAVTLTMAARLRRSMLTDSAVKSTFIAEPTSFVSWCSVRNYRLGYRQAGVVVSTIGFGPKTER